MYFKTLGAQDSGVLGAPGIVMEFFFSQGIAEKPREGSHHFLNVLKYPQFGNSSLIVLKSSKKKVNFSLKMFNF